MNKKNSDLQISGTMISPGIAVGRAFLYHDVLTRDISSYTISPNDVPYELQRITNAIEEVRKEIYQLSRSVSHNISSEDGNIFEAQRLMIEDHQFLYAFEKELRNELTNAERVVKNVFRRQIELLDGSSNEMIKAKADDLRDIFRKVLHRLLGSEKNILAKLPKNAIIIAKRLLPSDTVKLDQKNIEGIIVEEGSIHAHSALLARSLGIPALCTNGKPIKKLSDNGCTLIDGYKQIALLNVTEKTASKYREKRKESSIEVKRRKRTIKGIVKTKSGIPIQLLANANTVEEITASVKAGCDGIGLFRTETLYFQFERLPDEEYLFNSLKRAIEPLGDLPLIIRLLDIGGDKRLPYFDQSDEFSPFLGMRGVRLLLSKPAFLKTQIRALVKLNAIHKLKILIPMVTIPDEVAAVRKVLIQCQKEQGAPEQIPLGAMVETPSAALAIDDMLQVADFISIGTNDLTQYVMAASRENPNVAELYDRGGDYILPLVKKVKAACEKHDKQCSICGEIVNNEKYMRQYIEAGIDMFSVSAFRIPHLKSFVKTLKT